MLKKSLSLAAALILFCSAALAQETLTITTYYPSPYGSYNDMHVANRLGIGTTNPDSPLTIRGNAAAGANEYINLNGADWSTAPSANRFGINIDSAYTGAFAHGYNLTGVYSIVRQESANSLSGIYTGLEGYSYIDDNRGNSASPLGMVGIMGSALNRNTGSTVTGVAAFQAKDWGGTYGTAYTTNAYGLYINSPAAGAGVLGLQNAYAIYINNITGADVLNYSIYSAGGTNYFSGNVGIGRADPRAKLDVDGNIRLKPQSGNPGSWSAGVVGEFAYSSSQDKLYHYNGSQWVAQGGGGSVISLKCMIGAGSPLGCILDICIPPTCQSDWTDVGTGCAQTSCYSGYCERWCYKQ